MYFVVPVGHDNEMGNLNNRYFVLTIILPNIVSMKRNINSTYYYYYLPQPGV